MTAATHPIEIVFVEDDEDVRAGSAQALELAGFAVRPFESVEAARAAIVPGVAAVVLCDVRLPGTSGTAWQAELHRLDPALPVVLVTGHGDIAMAVQAMREGAYDFLEKPCSAEQLVAVVRRAADQRQLALEVASLRRQLESWPGIQAALLGRSAAMQRVRERVRVLAAAPADVVIYGETGTGKDLVARCLHEHGARRQGHFVPVNCAGLPETLVDSEIFGHEAGAFTGATRRRVGKFEHAHGGTLFLDEIEGMPLQVQAKLLRALQDRAIERLGSNAQVPVDCRVIAASKADLQALSEQGRFRSDLYYRLGVAFIALPALRERREDIPLLFEHFAQLAARRYELPAPPATPELTAQLMAHHWPGNVRELRNVAERYVLGLMDGPEARLPVLEAAAASLPEQLERIERVLVAEALRRAQGDVGATASALGIAKQTLYDKLKRLQIEAGAYRAR